MGAPPAPQGQPARFNSLSETLANELHARVVQAPRTAPPQHATGGPRPGEAADPHSRWSLGDLLKRASHEDERPPTAPAVAAPHAQLAHTAQPSQAHPGVPPAAAQQPFKLNIDVLARALDATTASAIWSRLKAGQRGIMVRSIYSAEGRHAFDELARRYPDDPSLQNTINRYLMDFERILHDTESKDATGRLAHSHRTSTMGRVYLLLAHASGRIS